MEVQDKHNLAEKPKLRLPLIGENVLIAGNPRAGKTVMARYLFSKMRDSFPHVLLFQKDKDLDGKPWENFADETIGHHFSTSQLMDEMRHFKTVCIRPSKLTPEDLQIVWGRVCNAALAMGNTLVINDEIAKISRPAWIHPYHLEFLEGNGRKRRCSMIQATQRLQGCPIQARTLSEHTFLYRLNPRDVRGYLASYYEEAEKILTLKPYECVYIFYDNGGQERSYVLAPVPY